MATGSSYTPEPVSVPSSTPTPPRKNNTGWIIGLIAAVVISGGIGIFAGMQIENNRIRSALSNAFQGIGSGSNSGGSDPAFSGVTTADQPAAQTQTVKIGDTVTLQSGGTVTAHSVDRNVPPVEYSSDREPRTAVDVEVCVSPTETEAKVSNAPWALLDSSNGRYEPGFDVDGPKPEYPSNYTAVPAGECVRGWILVDVPTASSVDRVRYTRDDGVTLTWTL